MCSSLPLTAKESRHPLTTGEFVREGHMRIGVEALFTSVTGSNIGEGCCYFPTLCLSFTFTDYCSESCGGATVARGLKRALEPIGASSWRAAITRRMSLERISTGLRNANKIQPRDEAGLGHA